MSSNTASSGKT